MIRAANHSSYPRAGDNPYERHLPDALERRGRGEASDEEVRAVEDEVAALVVAEHARAFIDIVTDGLVRWDGALTHPGRQLDGVEVAGTTIRIVGAVRPRGSFLAREYAVAAEVGARQLKMVLPGPVYFARSCDDRHYGDRAALARDVAACWAGEAAALAAAGCTMLQLDEPLLGRHPEDLELVAETAGRVFAAAGPRAATILSTWGAELGAVADRLDALPGTHLGLDLTSGGNWTVLASLPAGKGVHLGVFDARAAAVEDAADVAERLAPQRAFLEGRDVMVGPQCGLGALARDAAFDKLLHARYLAESLRKAWGRRA
jgi:5-methyltetrahydropteroyltriglutamate--homocysteine methyltransferase